MIVLSDMDDVVVDCEGGFLERWRATYPDRMFIPKAERTTFYIEDQYPAEYGDDVRAIKNAPGFFIGLSPIPDGLAMLLKIAARGHQVFLCSAPLHSSDTCASEKFQWVERHLGPEFRRRTILTKDKTMVRGQLLIDDRPEIVGAMTPEWEHVLCDASYNRHVTGKRRITWWDYEKVLAELFT